MQFWHKKAIFSGITKFQEIFRKIRTYALTLWFSPHSEKAFCHSVHMCYPALDSRYGLVHTLLHGQGEFDVIDLVF